MSEPRRISASRLNAIKQCTMKFYLSEILRLPEKVWARTHAGSCCHSILQVLYTPKHWSHYFLIKTHQSIYASPAIIRLVKAWQHKTKMSDEIVADIDSMCLVAINHSDFLDEGAVRRFEPEHEFNMTLENEATVRGFIDRLAQFPNSFVISDYKTARNKHSKADIVSSYQSLVYQLYVWKTYGALAEVRYYFLRHPPTARTPDKHVMVTPPATPDELAGFEYYLQHMWQVVNSFGIKEAHDGFCTDYGFCKNVCSYFKPFSYIRVTNRDTNDIIKNYSIDESPNLSDNEVAEVISHPGCPKHNV